jgi:hypothetical protein
MLEFESNIPIFCHLKNKVVDFVGQANSDLRSMLKKEPRHEGAFPLDTATNLSHVEKQMVKELKDSYDLYLDENLNGIPDPSQFVGVVSILLRDTKRKRVSVERKLFGHFSASKVDERLLQYSGKAVLPEPPDLLLLLVEPLYVQRLFRRIQELNLKSLCTDAVDWALLCVLEDKLGRVLHLDSQKEKLALVDEFECIREWGPHDHPRWFAFEVEQQLQIRPYQYQVVRQLLDEPGSMVQLNMGLGKTRVLVPMLVLEWASKDWLTRLNVLPQIIHEAIEFYRKSLVSSVQSIQLYTLPFHRSMALDASNESILSDELRRCKESNGILVVTPQHRNSLLLKQYDQEVFIDGLALQTRDIIDESDSILHYNFQLVYALGEQVPLPDGPSRWNTMQTLILLLSENNFELLVDPKLADRVMVRPGVSQSFACCNPSLLPRRGDMT